jgi:hypothetical protein
MTENSKENLLHCPAGWSPRGGHASWRPASSVRPSEK